MRQAAIAICALLVCMGISRPASAGFPGEVPERLQLQLGGTLATFDTSVGLGLKGGNLGATVVFEDMLDLPISKSVWRADGAWHFGDHHNLDFGYVDLDREAAREITEDIQFGNYTFLSDSRVTGKIKSRFIYAAYRHDFLKLDQVRIGGSAGASIMTLGASLSATAGVVDSTGNELQRAAEVGESITFPVPLLGFQVDWAVGQRSEIQFYARFFYLNTSTLRGGMSETAMRYYYFLTRSLGVGAGFDKIAIDIPKFKTSDYVVRAGYTVQGLSAYVRYAF
jgi:hypothetical protein